MNKAVFIDKDGTLIPDIPYNVNTGLIVLEEGVADGLRKLIKQGYLVVVITNQAGVALGYFTEKEVVDVEAHMVALLQKEDILLNGFYYCPHFPGGSVLQYSITCNCRKPAPGLLLRAAKDLNIDLASSWMIGDILNDVEAGNRAGCKSILVDNGNETEWLVDLDLRTPNFIANNFSQAAIYILDSVSNNETAMQPNSNEFKTGTVL